MPVKNGVKQSYESSYLGQKAIDNDRRNRGTKVVVIGYSHDSWRTYCMPKILLEITTGPRKGSHRTVSERNFLSRKFIKLPRGRGRPKKIK